jgi:drug/metabolite transporter (DMT)-like permease
MEPGEALSTAAQIAVTLAGFAGVVVVFRRESVHEWSPIDILPLGLCVTAILLLTIEPTLTGVWRWCSGAALLILLPFAIATTKSFRRFDSQQLKHAHATLFTFYLFVVLGSGGTVLQLCNVGILNAF